MARVKKEKFVEQKSRIPSIKPLNAKQADLLASLQADINLVVIGPAGTGKTFVPICYAADRYAVGSINRIILSRPNIEAGKSLGYRPGTLYEKLAEWHAASLATLNWRIGGATVEIALKRGNIEMVPLESMRGRSFDNAFIFIDEAQNTTPKEIEMILGRQGMGSQVVVNGDLEQKDVDGPSGLAHMLDVIRTQKLAVPVHQFGLDDIVRSDMCATWIKAFSKHRKGV